MPTLARLAKTLVLILLVGIGVQARAADTAGSDPIPADQLEQLVAPIALYPDALIAQILMASTYPLDIVQANRWLGDHEDLKDEALDKAVKGEPWDESVKALVFFPSVLGFMSDNLDWTQDLGDAVLAQQGELTDTIQRLRAEADKAGALTSNAQQRVEKAGDTIVIQPAQPEVVYVPSYDPVKVYGQSSPPATQYYPQAYADASSGYAEGYAAGQADATALVPSGQVVPAETAYVTASSSEGQYDDLMNFGLGAVAGGLLTAAIMWDDDDDWNDRLYQGGGGYYGGGGYWGQPNYWNNNGWQQPSNINVDRSRSTEINRNVERGDVTINKGIVGNEVKKWEHNPERRGGVRYRDNSTEKRFADKRKEGNIGRDEARGRAKAGTRDLKAPDLGAVKREGAASGGLAKLGEGRGDGGKVGDLRDRGGAGAGAGPAAGVRDRRGAGGGAAPAPPPAAGVRDRAAGGGEARAKAQARAPEARSRVQAKPKVQAAAATKRPVDRAAARPSTSQIKRPEAAARVQRPAGGAGIQRPAGGGGIQRPAGGGDRAQRPASRPSGGGGAFKASSPKMDRAASNRGSASRASAGRASAGGGGARASGARSGGGGRRR
jgi:hypothetical protein